MQIEAECSPILPLPVHYRRQRLIQVLCKLTGDSTEKSDSHGEQKDRESQENPEKDGSFAILQFASVGYQDEERRSDLCDDQSQSTQFEDGTVVPEQTTAINAIEIHQAILPVKLKTSRQPLASVPAYKIEHQKPH